MRRGRRGTGPEREPQDEDPASQVEIDLHGLTRERAIERLEQELTRYRAHGVAQVTIIVGRGWGSPRQNSVLAPAVDRWLEASGPRLGVVEVQVVARGGARRVRLQR